MHARQNTKRKPTQNHRELLVSAPSAASVSVPSVLVHWAVPLQTHAQEPSGRIVCEPQVGCKTSTRRGTTSSVASLLP